MIKLFTIQVVILPVKYLVVFFFLCVHRSRRCKVACVNKDYIMIEVTKKWFIYTKKSLDTLLKALYTIKR